MPPEKDAVSETEEQPEEQIPETPEPEPTTPKGSAATEEQIRDQEFMERLRRVMSPEAFAHLVAATPFAVKTVKSLDALGAEVEKQSQFTAAIHTDLETTSQNVQALLEVVNAIRAQVLGGGAPGGDGGAEELPIGGQNAELKWWVRELKEMVGLGTKQPEPAEAPKPDMSVESMKNMASAFKDVFGTLAGVINEVRRFDDDVGRRRPSRREEAQPVPEGTAE